MEAIKKKIIVPSSRLITFEVPSSIPPDASIEIIILYNKSATKNQKIKELQKSIQDTTFQNELAQKAEEINSIDNDAFSRFVKSP